MATSYERVLEAARRILEISGSKSFRATPPEDNTLSAAASPMTETAALHCTSPTTSPTAKPCCTASERSTAISLPLPVHLD
mgnify:CR=1 FL=1